MRRVLKNTLSISCKTITLNSLSNLANTNIGYILNKCLHVSSQSINIGIKYDKLFSCINIVNTLTSCDFYF